MHLAARTRVAREEAAATVQAAVRDSVAQVVDALAPRRVGGMQEYAVPETSTAFGIDQSYNEASLVRPAASETRLIDLYLRRL